MCEERQQGRRGEVAECHHDYNHPGTPPPHYHSHQHQDGIYVISAGTSCFKLPRAGLNRPQRRTQVRGVPSFVLIGMRESSSGSLSSFVRQTLSLSLSVSVSLSLSLSVCLSVCLPPPYLSLSSHFFPVAPVVLQPQNLKAVLPRRNQLFICSHISASHLYAAAKLGDSFAATKSLFHFWQQKCSCKNVLQLHVSERFSPVTLYDVNQMSEILFEISGST